MSTRMVVLIVVSSGLAALVGVAVVAVIVTW